MNARSLSHRPASAFSRPRMDVIEPSRAGTERHSSYERSPEVEYSNLQPQVSSDFSKLNMEAPKQNRPVCTVSSPGPMMLVIDGFLEPSPIPNSGANVPIKLPLPNHEEQSKNDEFPTMTTADESEGEESIEEFPVNTDIINLDRSSSSDEQYLADEDFEKYRGLDLESLDLQLIAVRRPLGKEYGDEESSI